jgi:hypothetical protein
MAASRACGIDRKDHYAWLRDDAEYAAQVEALVPQLAQAVLDELARRGVEGYDEPLANKGLLTGDSVRRFSDQCLITLHRHRFPERYIRREHTGPGGSPITLQIVKFVSPTQPTDGTRPTQPAEEK